jgi:hypothetical protein
VYLDEADHVGIDDQPFYYGGMLNVFKMRSTLVRMALSGGASLTQGQAAFGKAHAALAARGGGTISIYYHPNEWVQTEFWDGVNFSRGANPPAAEWKPPGVRPAAETEQAFADFEQFVRFIKAQEGVRFVTATELASLYADRAMDRTFRRNDMLDLARAMEKEVSFATFGPGFLQGSGGQEYALSAADIFSLLTAAGSGLIDAKTIPAGVKVTRLDGPTRGFTPSTGTLRSSSFRWSAFAAAVRDTAAYCRTHQRIPDEVWIGAENVSPADFLAMLADALEQVITSGQTPAMVERRSGRYTADRYVAADSPKLWGWVIFPEGFHAPRLMELARLQAWTLKPAVLNR